MAESLHLYIGTERGLSVWKRNGGWQALDQAEPLPPGRFWLMAGHPQRPERVFASVSNAGLFRTEDAGRTWKLVLDRDVRSVAVDPTDARVVYAGTEPVRLFRSEDGGDSWQELW